MKKKQTEIPPEYLCPVCKKMIKDAVQIPCCKKNFCDLCIRDELDKHNFNCPFCNKMLDSLESLSSNNLIRKKIIDFNVSNKNKNSGLLSNFSNDFHSKDNENESSIPTFQENENKKNSFNGDNNGNDHHSNNNIYNGAQYDKHHQKFEKRKYHDRDYSSFGDDKNPSSRSDTPSRDDKRYKRDESHERSSNHHKRDDFRKDENRNERRTSDYSRRENSRNNNSHKNKN